MMPTLSCCFPHCCAPINPFIYFKRATSAVWCPNIVFFLFVCYYPAAAVSKQQSVAKCSFVCALRGLMGYYAEWPDSPCTISGGLERHKHNVVRPTPLSLSSHCQHITSPGPVGNVTSDVWMYLTTLPLLSLQRAWRSTSVNLARWRSAWWCGIPLPSGRGKKEACALRRPITGCLMPFHAFPRELFFF